MEAWIIHFVVAEDGRSISLAFTNIWKVFNAELIRLINSHDKGKTISRNVIKIVYRRLLLRRKL